MIYQTRTYTFPDGDSKWDKITGYRVENRCYRNVPMQKGETRNGKCPAGHTGAVKETRNSEGEECVGPTLPKCRGGGGNGGNGGPDNEGHNSWDVDGDGRGDYADRNAAESAGHTGGRSVSDDCSSCGESPGEKDAGRGNEDE